MGVGSGGREGPCSPWIFIHGTDIVDRDLIVLFFVLFLYFSVFFLLPPPPEKCLPTPLAKINKVPQAGFLEQFN